MKTCYRAFIALESRTCNLSAGRPMVVLGLLAGALMLSCPGTMRAQTTFNWTNNASGNWSDSINWMNGQVGDGAGNTAIFTLNITANRTVTLDTNRTLGVIQMSDTSANQVWTLAGTNILTMDNGLSKAGVRAPSTPVTISVVIAGGTNGIKCPDQAGTMTLSAIVPAWSGHLIPLVPPAITTLIVTGVDGARTPALLSPLSMVRMLVPARVQTWFAEVSLI